jgi:hypothetical protein
MNRTEYKSNASGGIGWEGTLSSIALILLVLNFGVQSWLGPVHTLALVAGIVALVSGVISTCIAFWDGSGWLGAILPLAWAAAGLWTLLH